MKKIYPFIIIGLFFAPTLTFGAPATYNLSLAPFSGTGETSFRGDVRHVNGVSLGINAQFEVSSLSIGPRIELTNSLFSIKSSTSNNETITTYDNKLISLGFGVNFPQISSLRTSVFTNLMGGVASSDITVNQNTESSYANFTAEDARGLSISFEVGTLTELPMNNLELLFAFTANRIFLKQSGLYGERYSESSNPNNGGLSLTNSVGSQEDQNIHDAVTQQTLGLKLGISLRI